MEKIREQRNTIFVCVITAFITTFMGSALNLSIPSLEEEFRVGAQTVGWVITIYMLTCAALAVPFGRLSDRVERQSILRMGILIFCISSLTAVLSKNMWMLLTFRLMQGIGASMIFSTNIAILVGAFDEEHRGRVLGYSTCATYAGLSAGPVLGGVLNQNLGWRSIFIATSIVSAAAFYGAFFKLPKHQKKSAKNELPSKLHWDYVGNILFVISIVLTMYGLSSLKSIGAAPFILFGGILLFIFFVRTEMKAENPVIDVNLFRKNISFTLSNLAAMVNYGSNFALSYLMSIYLQVVKGMSSQWAGMILITNTLIMTLLSPIVGRISDRLSPFKMSAAGMALCAAAMGLLSFLSQNASLISIILILALSGVGFSLFSTPNTNAVMSCVERKDYGVSASILSTMRSIGHTAGMSVVTAVVGIYIGSGSLKGAGADVLMKTFHICFFIFTLLCILGIFMAAKRKV